MKVLHLNENYTINGGTETYIHNLQAELTRLSIESSFLAISCEFGKYKLIGESDFRLMFNKKSAFFGYFENFIKKNDFSIIHIHNISDTLLIDKCLQLLPVIRSFHDQRMFCPGNQKFLLNTETICEKPFSMSCICNGFKFRCMSIRPLKMLEQYRRVRYDLNMNIKYFSIIVASEYMKNEAVFIGYNSDSIKIIPYFSNDLGLQTQVDLNSKKAKKILFVGRLHQSKGIHLLIESMKIIFEKFDCVHLDIVGDGDFRNFLDELLFNLDIDSSRITFHGWLGPNEVGELMGLSTVVVFPSIYPEAFGIVGIEAMSLSKPVVGFNVGGVRDWLTNEKTGLLIDDISVTGLTNGIVRLLSDCDLYDSISRSSRMFFDSKYATKIHVDNLVQLYASVKSAI